jgi:osmotically-inducible protein OsmY
MKILKKITTIFAVLLFVFSTSCVETVVVGSAATGVLVMREKTLSKTQGDVLIATKLGSEFVKNGLKNPGNSVDITVNEGRVLLTGIVRDKKRAQLALDLAWKINGVKEVIDEIQLSNSGLRPKDFSKSIADYLISAQVETKLLFGRNVSSLNYKITTVNKVVYLIGVASDAEEIRKVLTITAKVRGVEKVVNYIILIDDRRRNG